MRKPQIKNMRKRVLSVALALGMVLTMLPADAIQAAAKKVTDDGTAITTSEYSDVSNTKSLTRERRVLKSLPAINRTKTKGSIENPFIILEVVPYMDYSSIGYLVEGCEPVDMDSLRGNKMAIESLTGSDGDFFGFGKFTLASGNVFFFPDEEEGTRAFYQNTNLTNQDLAAEGIAKKESGYRFTPDEWNAKEQSETRTIYGYYEVVEKGTGKFILEDVTDAEGNTVKQIRKASETSSADQAETTLVWHTVNNYLLDEYKREGVYSDRMFLAMSNLNNPTAFAKLKIDYNADPSYVGNRFYTIREGGDADPYYDLTGELYTYQSNDLFVRNTLGKSASDAKKYSVAVKTITPYELNTNPTWIGIADLVYFNCDLTLFKDTGAMNGVRDDDEAALIDLWQSTKVGGAVTLSRFGIKSMLDADKKPETTKGFRGNYNRSNDIYPGKSRDITFSTFQEILKRVTKAGDYLALVFDQSCVADGNNDVVSNVTYHGYRLENYANSTLPGTVTAKGYKNNVAKLWLTCTSANPGFVQRFFFDKSVNAAGDGVSSFENLAADSTNDVIVFRNGARNAMGTGANDEKYCWSGYTFYCGSESYPDSGWYNVDAKDYWKNYAGDLTHSLDPYYVQGHVFVTPAGISLVDGYANAYNSTKAEFTSAAERYEDFDDFLASTGNGVKAAKASSSLAVRYVVDPNKLVNYYFDDSIKVLDIEPSVAMNTNYGYSWVIDGRDIIKLIPKRIGSDTRIKTIEHQVMQTFVAKNEDLNSTYDLIYLGDDIGGLWTGIDTANAQYAEKGKIIGQREVQVWIEGYWQDYYKWVDRGWWEGRYVQGYWDSSRNVWVEGYYIEHDKWHENWVQEYDGGEWIDGHYETQMQDVYEAKDAYAGTERTDFVDNSMDGLVYFHIGDTLQVNPDSYGEAAFLGSSERTQTRQPGNDLTYKKQEKLVEYLRAEYPIVIANNLYEPKNTSGHRYVDGSSACVINQFLVTYDPAKHVDSTGKYSECYYTRDMLAEIDKMVSNRLKGRVDIVSGPKEYDSQTALNNRYLPDSDGYAVLEFKVNVPNTTDYMYRVFVDRNRDSNFTYDGSNDQKNEVITSGTRGYVPLTKLENTLRVPLPEKWVGFVQWRIEVVNKNNEYKRYSLEGCSAVKADPSSTDPDRAKQKIVALQIMPTHNNTKDNYDIAGSWVDLSNRALNSKNVENYAKSGDWQYLYNQVDDFDISVVKITWRQFMQLFKPGPGEEKFRFNMGANIAITDDGTSNPNKSVLARVENRPIAFRNLDDAELLTVSGAEADKYYTLADFNMIVLGFDDTYGFTDMSNEYGSVEYLYYFALKGCSILFTHDTTSQHTDPNYSPFELGWKTITDHRFDQWHEVRVFGYTGNTMMREIMGMNRYMKSSIYLEADTDPYVNFRSGLKDDIQGYVRNNITYDKGYDSVSQAGLHAYTTFNLMRYSCTDANNGSNGRVQYKYMVLNPNNPSSAPYKNGGAYNDGGNTMSEVVTRVNEGQITQYPFTIGTGSGTNRTTQFRVGQTHGQWWQLNMEDEDLTVWYTLEDPAMSTICPNDAYKNRSDFEHISLMYSAVPMDAANNYYIYSKGNIFYSGVGHSNVEGEEEKKLFVNTLVAAYRPKYGLPFIQVTSSEASLTKSSPRTYTVTIPMDYAYNADGSIDMANSQPLVSGASTDFVDGDYIYVKFKAMDNNGCTSIFTSAKFTATGADVLIYSSLVNAKNNAPMSYKFASEKTYELTVGDEYYVRYHKNLLNTVENKIVFESYNNRITTGETDLTYLEFKAQPLFDLD